jgi:hypothetical protein
MRTFIPGRYWALALTNQRLILKDLGSASAWFLFFGLIGVYIGKSLARKTGELLQHNNGWLPARNDRELTLDQIDALTIRQTVLGITVLAITYYGETEEYTFDGLNERTAQDFLRVFHGQRTGTSAAQAGTARDSTVFKPRYPRFFWASVLLSFFYPLAPIGLWLALKCHKDAVVADWGRGKSMFAIIWASFFCLMLACLVCMLLVELTTGWD